MVARTLCLHAAGVLAFLGAAAAPLHGQISGSNVLLVVNTASADSTAIRDAYQAKYPNVRIWQYSGSTAPSVSRQVFEDELRVPLDDYLESTLAGGVPLYRLVRVIVTTKGVPRRVYDIDGTSIGDDVIAMLSEYNANRYDAACVDSELVMLHQDLRAGDLPEPSGLPKNYANNYVCNPYYAQTSRIHTYSRTYATTAKDLKIVSRGWQNAGAETATRLGPGDIYLVTRLSGYTAAEAVAAISRGGVHQVDRHGSMVVIDGDAVNSYDAGDYYSTNALLSSERMSHEYDKTAVFLASGQPDALGYTSYGRNHSPAPDRRYVIDTLNFTLRPGAIFNTYESWNGRNFESLEPHDVHGQLADWIHVGGTLGFGHVFEPLAFSVADNQILYERMLTRGWTFAEAAYASLPVISWQNVVVGDPLTRFETLPDLDGWQVVASHGPLGEIATEVEDGYVEPRTQGIRKLMAVFGVAVDPATIPAAPVTITGVRTGNQSGLIQSATFDPTYYQLTIQLSAALPDADRYTVTLSPDLRDANGLSYTGNTELMISALAGDVDGSGHTTGADMLTVRAASGAVPSSLTARYDVDCSGVVAAADLAAVRILAGHTLP